MRRFFQYFWLPFYRRWCWWQARRPQVYVHAGLRLGVPPGVFHPGLYFSTPIFIGFLKKVDFKGKKTLDVGTGSGLLALFAAKNGAIATAIDIHPLAVGTAQKNATDNHLPLTVLESDLFDQLPPQTFDYILINPPYYPKKAQNHQEQAFFAGENLEYFHKLFRQLPAFMHKNTKIWLILSEDCDFEQMQRIAHTNGLPLRAVFQQKKWGERLFVAEVSQRE